MSGSKPAPARPDRRVGVAVLKDYDIWSTNFTIGRRLAAPGGLDLAERAWRVGHWIGNHTWSHDVPLGESRAPDLVETELAATR